MSLDKSSVMWLICILIVWLICILIVQCFLFHINQGLRSGGGIGKLMGWNGYTLFLTFIVMVADVLEPAVGDSYEFLRLCFDITFFFVVVVILLAIIQGLLPSHTPSRDPYGLFFARVDSWCFWAAAWWRRLCCPGDAGICHLFSTTKVPPVHPSLLWHRPNVLFVDWEIMSLITFPMALTTTSARIIALRITCKVMSSSTCHRPCLNTGCQNRFLLLYLIKKRESEFSGQVSFHSSPSTVPTPLLPTHCSYSTLTHSSPPTHFSPPTHSTPPHPYPYIGTFQESFVWEMYLKRDWDIFPVGKCFQLQETNSSSETAN